MNSNAVSVLPPTAGIKDSATRSFLDALTNLLDARSGYTNKDAPERFITAAEFEGLTNRALFQAFSKGGSAPGSGGGGGVPSATEINDSIDNLADFIRKSLVYQILGEQVDLIDIAALRQRVADLGTGIFREEQVRKSADEAFASSLTTVQAQLGNVQAGVANEIVTRATKDAALASAVNTIWAAIGGSEAVIQDGSLASATPNSSQASKWNQVVASVTDPNTGQVSATSIKQELRSYASNADGKFNSIYSVRAQVAVNGMTVVGGFGLSAVGGAAGAAGPAIAFGVRADTFFIAATAGTPGADEQIAQGGALPFMVLTRNEVVNGVVYGPGVYLKKAVIGSATIGEAQIADLAVTTAKIREASIDTLRVRGAAITGNAFGEGGGGRLGAGAAADVAAASIDMPSGSSGVVATLFINMAGVGAGATIGIALTRQGALVKEVLVSVVGGFYGTFTVPVFDPYPVPGVATYTLRIRNVTSGPGANVQVDFQYPIVILSGAKR